jgi:hypothetical protein
MPDPLPSKAPPQSAPFSLTSPFPPGSLPPSTPEKRPSVVQRAKTPTLWTVLGIVIAEVVRTLLTSHGASPALVDAAARAAQQATEQAAPSNH